MADNNNTRVPTLFWRLTSIFLCVLALFSVWKLFFEKQTLTKDQNARVIELMEPKNNQERESPVKRIDDIEKDD